MLGKFLKMKIKIILYLFLICYCYGVHSSPSRNIDEKKSVFKKISECLHNGDSFVCLKEYTVTLLNDAIVNDKTISVSSYFDIVKDQNYHLKEEDKLNDNKLHQLDTIQNQTEKNIVLDELITDKLEQFLESRSLKINFAPVIEGKGIIRIL